MSDPGTEKSEVVDIPLTAEEDHFALAVIEYNGNLKAAYSAVFGEEAKSPLANARLLASKPSVVARVRQIMFAHEEQALISTSAHLAELAEIRDMAKKMQAPKAALEAEKLRGEVAGFYTKQSQIPEGLNLELARDAQALSKFVQDTMSKLAESLPV